MVWGGGREGVRREEVDGSLEGVRRIGAGECDGVGGGVVDMWEEMRAAWLGVGRDPG